MWKKITILKADSRTTGFPPRENKTNIKRFFLIQYRKTANSNKRE